MSSVLLLVVSGAMNDIPLFALAVPKTEIMVVSTAIAMKAMMAMIMVMTVTLFMPLSVH